MKRLTTLGIATFMLVLGATPAARASGVPRYLSVQGVLRDNLGDPVTSARNFTFRIYNVSSGGSALWTEVQALTPDEGRYSFLLGTNTALDLPFDQDYWLGIEIDSDGEMNPRYRIASSAYAFTAETLCGIPVLPTPMADFLLPLDGLAKFPVSVIDTGAGANQIVQLDGDGKLPGVDGSNLANVSAANSDTVDLIHASATRLPDHLLALGAGGTFPNDALNIGEGAEQIVKLDANAKLPPVDGSQLTNVAGIVPIGGVLPWLKSVAGTPALPANFVECNGQTLSDAASPYNGQAIPNLNGGNYFLRGAGASGGTGGSTQHHHQWLHDPGGAGGYMMLNSGASHHQTWLSDGTTLADMVTMDCYTNKASSLPPYYGVVWIMRVK